MELNKENIDRSKSSTRIPLPVEPLPPLPKHLLQETKKVSETGRQPLRTISNENVAGPSHGKVPHKKKRPVIVDARHVTLRQRKEENLDWTYNVFREDHSTTSVSPIAELVKRDDVNAEELRYFVYNTQKIGLGEAEMAVTPSIKSSILEPSRVKNIKRSLKRPHSRELQGISPLPKQEKREQEKVKRQLQFNESLQEKLLSPDFLNKSYMKCLTRDYTTDMFSYLLVVEKKPFEVPRNPSITRACVINWLMKVNGADGNPGVVQSACWYLDSILGTVHVLLEKLQLVAAACYWIAQKLHGPVYPATRLVKFASHAFSSQRLMAAEKAVLQKLKFPPQPVVAQDFINYLSWWCDNNHPGEIEIAATFLCMSGIMVDKSLCEEYPSVIAAASVRNALLLLKKRNLMMHLEMCPLYKSAQNKATNMACTHSLLRKAVRMVASPCYEYKAPFEHYGVPPVYLAQRIAEAANDFSVLDTRNINQGHVNIF